MPMRPPFLSPLIFLHHPELNWFKFTKEGVMQCEKKLNNNDNNDNDDNNSNNNKASSIIE